jgi:hypothetical protein
MKRTLIYRFLKSVPVAPRGKHADDTDSHRSRSGSQGQHNGQKTFVLVSPFPGRKNPNQRAIGSCPAMTIDKGRTRGTRMARSDPARD